MIVAMKPIYFPIPKGCHRPYELYHSFGVSNKRNFGSTKISPFQGLSDICSMHGPRRAINTNAAIPGGWSGQ